jgi:hypothetical protein
VARQPPVFAERTHKNALHSRLFRILCGHTVVTRGSWHLLVLTGGRVGLRCSDAPARPHEAGLSWPAEFAGFGAAREPSDEQSSACAWHTVAAPQVAVPAPPQFATPPNPLPGWTCTMSVSALRQTSPSEYGAGAIALHGATGRDASCARLSSPLQKEPSVWRKGRTDRSVLGTTRNACSTAPRSSVAARLRVASSLCLGGN